MAVTQDFINYALPLIQGENHRTMENGLPRFAQLKRFWQSKIGQKSTGVPIGTPVLLFMLYHRKRLS